MAYVCFSCKRRVTYNEGKPCIYCDKVSKTTFGERGIEINRKSSPKYSHPWTEEDEAKLMDLEALGYSLQQLSIVFKRSKGSIKSKIRKLKKENKRDGFECPKCQGTNIWDQEVCRKCGHNGYVYVLKLVEEKYYVGWSSRPGMRIEQHFSMKGSPWTKKYRPLEIQSIEKGNLNWEKETIAYFDKKYGKDNVGGS